MQTTYQSDCCRFPAYPRMNHVCQDESVYLSLSNKTSSFFLWRIQLVLRKTRSRSKFVISLEPNPRRSEKTQTKGEEEEGLSDSHYTFMTI